MVLSEGSEGAKQNLKYDGDTAATLTGRGGST